MNVDLMMMMMLLLLLLLLLLLMMMMDKIHPMMMMFVHLKINNQMKMDLNYHSIQFLLNDVVQIWWNFHLIVHVFDDELVVLEDQLSTNLIYLQFH
jgi:predicted metal-binding membrane protein